MGNIDHLLLYYYVVPLSKKHLILNTNLKYVNVRIVYAYNFYQKNFIFKIKYNEHIISYFGYFHIN